jgi:CO/xanthine dehydrogenase Mo-binding subunit
MGGNFGTRNFFYPEYALLAWATHRVGRPLKWTCERSEAFLSDYQGRDLSVEAELALDEEGNFLAVRGSNLSTAADGELHGLRDAACRHIAVLGDGAKRSALADEQTWRALRRRGRYDTGADPCGSSALNRNPEHPGSPA